MTLPSLIETAATAPLSGLLLLVRIGSRDSIIAASTCGLARGISGQFCVGFGQLGDLRNIGNRELFFLLGLGFSCLADDVDDLANLEAGVDDLEIEAGAEVDQLLTRTRAWCHPMSTVRLCDCRL